MCAHKQMRNRTCRRVGIIGAGAAGLCAARHATAAGYETIVFEQQAALGGLWRYSSDPRAYSAVYEQMRANTPTQLMSFEHLPFKMDAAESSYPTASKVFDYLRQYAEPILHTIRFETVVTRIEHIDHDDDDDDNDDDNDNACGEWRVTSEPAISAPIVEANASVDYSGVALGDATRCRIEMFDALFIANGHFSVVALPQWASELRIRWLHSHAYRRADEFDGQRVVVVGAGASGIDIALQLSERCAQVFLPCNALHKDGNQRAVRECAFAIGTEDDGRALLLSDGSRLEQLDAVIFATGYKFALPFASDDIARVRADAKIVSPTYQHLVHTRWPRSLFFVGLRWSILSFMCFDYQLRYALALIDGTATVPSVTKLAEWEAKRERSVCSCSCRCIRAEAWKRLLAKICLENVCSELTRTSQPLAWFHHASAEQWAYYDELAALANAKPPSRVLRAIYNHVHTQRSTDAAVYKRGRYRVLDDERFNYELINE